MPPETSYSVPSALDSASMLAAMVAGKRQERLERRSNEPPFKPRRNYASGLSSCVRQMTYAHTHWDQKEPFGVDGVAHMEDGNHVEILSNGADTYPRVWADLFKAKETITFQMYFGNPGAVAYDSRREEILVPN